MMLFLGGGALVFFLVRIGTFLADVQLFLEVVAGIVLSIIAIVQIVNIVCRSVKEV
jgi:hypothetical protein